MNLYAPGEHAVTHADLFPASILPRPEEVPRGAKLRVVLTERGITLLWQEGVTAAGPKIGRLDIPVSPEESKEFTFRGGTAAGFAVTQAGGCGCGAKAVRSVPPFPGASIVAEPRATLASTRPTGAAYGVPPRRYQRIR